MLTLSAQTLDPSPLSRPLWLVLHHCQLLLQMGQGLVPFGFHLRRSDLWYRCLQGLPCSSSKRKQAGQRIDACF